MTWNDVLKYFQNNTVSQLALKSKVKAYNHVTKTLVPVKLKRATDSDEDYELGLEEGDLYFE